MKTVMMFAMMVLVCACEMEGKNFQNDDLNSPDGDTNNESSVNKVDTFNQDANSGGSSVKGFSADISASEQADEVSNSDFSNLNEELEYTAYSYGDGSDGTLLVTSNYGYIDIGPKNDNWSHFYTDREKYFFDTAIYVNGDGVAQIGAYASDDLALVAGGENRIFIDSSTGRVGLGLEGGDGVPNEKVVIGEDWNQGYAGERLIIANPSGAAGIVFGKSHAERGCLTFEEDNTVRLGSAGSEPIVTMDKVGIKITDPQYALDVNGTIRAEELILETVWADFVFGENYELMPLEDVEHFINKNGHLPDIRSEADVDQNGATIGEAHARLLQKVEELTLYIIEQNKRIKNLESQIESGEKI